ncbi:MAG: hypothetical protein HZA22_02380 [Nitrospirae bacterium]|nr:hypothetical protein [Nitrospirota bacterium]MBI5696335.1 hypothetical protein [Nitrospirota bacterium]
MLFRILPPRAALFAAALLLVPALLAGCAGVGVATQADLDPIRSDINVLEKQFVEVQKAAMEARYKNQGGQSSPGEQAVVSGLESRISAIEKRLAGLEAGIAELKQAQAVTAPQPMAPEPVVIEPIEEAPRPAR